MNFKNSIFTIIFAIGTILFYGACSSSSKSDEQESEEHSHDEGSDHTETDVPMDDHDTDGQEDDESSSGSGDELVWIFSDSDDDIFSKSFHFVIGSADDIDSTVSGDEVTLNSNGNPSTFVFHNKMGNVGVEISYMLHGFKGEIKLVHHFKDAENYEFVSVNGNQMNLGRIINGEQNIFDQKSFELETSDWTQLRVSAAGSHYKGYIGSETITHGHGDELDAGYVGMMIDGEGSFMVKDLKVTRMERE